VNSCERRQPPASSHQPPARGAAWRVPRRRSTGFQASLHDHMLYHMVMARREVLVQLEDDLVEALDRIAVERSMSRSELLRRAARLFVDAFEEVKADAALVEAYRRHPQDPIETEAYMRLALESWPEW